MKGEILIVLWCGIIAYVERNKSSVCRIETDEDGKRVWRATMAFAVLAFLPVILWAAFRQESGYADTGAYIRLYNEIPVQWEEVKTFVSAIGKDPVFFYFVALIKHFFQNSYRPFLAIVAVIQGISMMMFYRRYSPVFSLSFFLFVISGDYLSWMMNG